MKKELLLTKRKQFVVGMIKGIFGEAGGSRVRKLQAKVVSSAEASGNPVAKCLVADTIKALVEAKILLRIAKGIAPGDEANGEKIPSVLHEWDQKAFDSYEIRTVMRRPAKKKRVKKAKDEIKATAPSVPPETTEDWYTRHKRETREMEAQYEAMGLILAGRKELEEQVEESIENVRRCFANREAK